MTVVTIPGPSPTVTTVTGGRGGEGAAARVLGDLLEEVHPQRAPAGLADGGDPSPAAGAPPGYPTRAQVLAQVARATARLWRGLTYDEAIAVAGAARAELLLDRPAKGRRIVDRLTRPELDRLLDHAYRVRGLYGLMVRTMVLTGARVSEFVALVDGDVNLDDCEITIRHGKGGKARVVPILPELGRELRLHLDMGGRRGSRVYGPLFQTRSWRAFSRRRVQAIVKELAAGAGITKRVYPHLLRHTIAQHLTDRGMPLAEVQRFLGHAKIDTTQIYAESSTAAIRTSYRKALE